MIDPVWVVVAGFVGHHARTVLNVVAVGAQAVAGYFDRSTAGAPPDKRPL